MTRALETSTWDLVVSDYVLPRFSGLDALTLLRNRDQNLPFIILSGQIGEDTAVAAMKLGANDYLLKGKISRLIPAIERELLDAAVRRDKKRAEEALSKSEQRYRRLVNAVTDYIYQVRMNNGTVVSTSHGPGCHAVTGYTPEEYEQNPMLWYEMTFEEDRQAVKDLSKSMKSSRELPPLEHRIVRKDGEIRWVRNTVVPKYNTKGVLVGYDGLVSDITERKRFEQELLLQSAALNAAANAIVITDTAGIVKWVNPAFTDLTQYLPEDVIGRTLNILKSGLQEKELFTRLWETISSGNVWQGEIINRRKDGTFYPEEQTITPVRDDRGEIRHFIAIKQDVTERKVAEQALVENAQLHMEMEVGKKIQLSLLPAAPPDVQGVEIAGKLEAASHVGGDYYDYFGHNNDCVTLIIADVSGHSIGAALIMAEARALLRSFSSTEMSTAELLRIVGNLLYEDLGKAELLITLFYARYDHRQRRLTYANAGHTPAILFHGATQTFSELDSEGLIIGVSLNVGFEEREISLQQGDILILHTDGIIESSNHNGELFGIERFKQTISACAHLSPNGIISEVFAALFGFTGKSSLQDDVSIVVMKTS
jgi:sigma-B regulation protein RsbU (phosphoserine phosphatase)